MSKWLFFLKPASSFHQMNTFFEMLFNYTQGLGVASKDLDFHADSFTYYLSDTAATSQKIAVICKTEIIVFAPAYFTVLLLRIK